MKHTEGPWEIGKCNSGPVSGTIPIHTHDYMESYRSGMLVCSVYGTATFSEANARLIAAAPELLEALKAMMRLTVSDNGEYLADAITDMAQAALNKAEGRDDACVGVADIIGTLPD